MKSVVDRKALATWITVSFVVVTLAFYFSGRAHNSFFAWTFVSLIHGGLTVALFGNAVSMLIEYLHSKWSTMNGLLYITLHSFFGLLSGILLGNVVFLTIAIVSATLFGSVDYWLKIKKRSTYALTSIGVFPVAVIVGIWLFTKITQGPFTEAQAIDVATNGQSVPDYSGEQTETIGAYEVKRTTEREKIDTNTYVVIFIESWSNEYYSGEWYISYKVNRHDAEVLDSGGRRVPDTR
ncbi:hypothetical protein H0266_15385 [Halobacillus locisalis]|uniref:Uncharacterized protein n=1 Tax=Halobacillus locisalis TaxID=220753 RepID=A0A838CWE0_9BACI|nr:hypothetical protein [Halobacillus locisalis]MBA2176280.1 hypothetical protein [Halobacillus locisalis]